METRGKDKVKRKSRPKKTIFIEMTLDGEVVQIFYGNEMLQKKYGKAIMNRIYRLTRRAPKSGIVIKGNLWASLPYQEYKKKSQEVAKIAKEQVKDLVLRYIFKEYFHQDMRKILSSEELDEVLKVLKPKFKI